jgi:hypothetical protein
MRFMIIVKGDAQTEAGALPDPEAIAGMARYHEQLQEAGLLVGASGLRSSALGFRVRYTGNSRSVIDGPFAETKELIAGYTIIRVDSREQAIQWAKRFPNPRGEGSDCEIEVRQMFELDDFEPCEGVERFRSMDGSG